MLILLCCSLCDMTSSESDRYRLDDSSERIAILTSSSSTTQYYEASQNLDSRQSSRSSSFSLLERRTVSRSSDDSYTLSSHSNHRRFFDLDRHNLRWERSLREGRATIRTRTCQCETYVKTWSSLACARLAEITDLVDSLTRLFDSSVYESNDLERQSTITSQVDNAGEKIAISLKRLLSIVRWRSVKRMLDAISRYVIVEIFNDMNNVLKESLVYFKSTWRHDLRKSLRSVIHDIREWRRILSLKRVTDFDVYKVCYDLTQAKSSMLRTNLDNTSAIHHLVLTSVSLLTSKHKQHSRSSFLTTTARISAWSSDTSEYSRIWIRGENLMMSTIHWSSSLNDLSRW